MQLIYASINGYLVINTQIITSSDIPFLNPALTWVDITNMDSPPSIGWRYDGSIFYPPAE